MFLVSIKRSKRQIQKVDFLHEFNKKMINLILKRFIPNFVNTIKYSK